MLDAELCAGWPDVVAAALKAGQQLRSQVRAVRLFRASAGADFSALWNCGGGQGGAASSMLLAQVRAKLDSMLKELDSLTRIEARLQELIGLLMPEVAIAL